MGPHILGPCNQKEVVRAFPSPHPLPLALTLGRDPRGVGEELRQSGPRVGSIIPGGTEREDARGQPSSLSGFRVQRGVAASPQPLQGWRREVGREWMETSEVKHNHPPDTDPGGIWDDGKGRDREKNMVITYRKACNCFFFPLKLRMFPPRTAFKDHRELLFMTLSYFSAQQNFLSPCFTLL